MLKLILCSATFTVISIVSLAASAASAASAQPDDSTFGFDLLQQVLPEDPHGNVIVAPRNIRTALAAVATGAKGTTQAQIVSLTGNYDSIDNRATDTAKSALLVWVAPRGSLNPKFIDGLHGTDVISTPPAEGAATINAYITKQTQGMINHVVDDVSGSPMVLATAMYFDGHWEVPFNTKLTHRGDFHITVDATEPVQLMHRDGWFSYAENGDGQIVKVWYKSDDNLCLTVFLPRKGLSIDKWLARTGGEQWLALTASAYSDRPGALELPKLKTGFSGSLKFSLQHMGIQLPFTPNANFSGILEHARLMIGDVIHVTQVDMDEKGTEAAAATVAPMAVGAAPMREPPPPPFRMIVDRPYFFTIGDASNQHILFAGVIRKP